MNSLRSALVVGGAALALAAPSQAENAALQISLDKSKVEASGADPFRLTLEGQPGHIPVLIVGTRRGQSPLPGVGIVGIDENPQPYLMLMGLIPPAGELVRTITLECGNPLITDGPVYLQAVTFDPQAMAFDQISNLLAFEVLAGDCGMCAQEARTDEYAQYSGGHALWLPGIGNDFVFASGGLFTEREDGRARLMGVVRSSANPSKAFAVDVMFEGRVSPLDLQHPPAGSPKKELKPEAYVENGGPIDASNWHYYPVFEGVLMGLDAYEGAILTVARRGPAFQVGLGADGKSGVPGGSGWLSWSVLEQPSKGAALQASGDGDINVDLCGECVECVEEAGDHAITLPAYGDDFRFVSGGQFEERADGTARLSGVLQNDVDPLNRWDVVIDFGGRMVPMSPAFPPAGSPKKELSASKYVENGGVVDPATWHYYQTIVGRLVGLDDNAGVELELVRRGPAFQVGVGANGKNTNYGGSGWLDVVEIGTGAKSVGDINVDMQNCE